MYILLEYLACVLFALLGSGLILATCAALVLVWDGTRALRNFLLQFAWGRRSRNAQRPAAYTIVDTEFAPLHRRPDMDNAGFPVGGNVGRRVRRTGRSRWKHWQEGSSAV
jgi:hypothetical protein